MTGHCSLSFDLAGDHPQALDVVGIAHVDVEFIERPEPLGASAHRHTPCRGHTALVEDHDFCALGRAARIRGSSTCWAGSDDGQID